MIDSHAFRQTKKGWFAGLALLFALTAAGQSDSLLHQATVNEVVQYALQHQPLVEQAGYDEAMTSAMVKSKLADWYPQVNFSYNYLHNFKVQTAVIGGNPIKLGVSNTSSLQFTLSQQIFNRDVLLASRTAEDVREASRLNTVNTKVEVAANAAKAFYAVLTSLQQIKVAEEDIARLQRSLQDATSRYQAGITDKTDYKRATIALNNTRAMKNSEQEMLEARMAYLKAAIGYPADAGLDISYDSLAMEKEALLDTLPQLDVTARPEYQLLLTQRRLYEADLRYNKWGYLPSLSANGAYNLNFQNNELGKLYARNYPASYAGLTLAFPIFQGGKRKADVEQAEWQLKKVSSELSGLAQNINAEYRQAMATYRSYLESYTAIRENLQLAQEVYDVIRLQYQSGVKTYLEVITAETDLRTARINYFNTLYQLLSSKIDVQKAIGAIPIQY